MTVPALTRLQLQGVTLCCVDTRSPSMAVLALRQSMKHCDFGRVVLFSDASARHAPLDLDGIEVIDIEALRNVEQYSHFILKLLPAHVETSHALIVQWDGFVVDPSAWRDEFLQYDYLGAPWIHGEVRGLVGNGGFSLRSKRLLDLVAQDDFEIVGPEDLCICVHHRRRLESTHDMKFPTAGLAAHFSHERGDWGAPFGFHGLFNVPNFMPPPMLRSYVDEVPQDLCTSADARTLIRTLMAMGDTRNARVLLNKRRSAQGLTWDGVGLRVRLEAKALAAGAGMALGH